MIGYAFRCSAGLRLMLAVSPRVPLSYSMLTCLAGAPYLRDTSRSQAVVLILQQCAEGNCLGRSEEEKMNRNLITMLIATAAVAAMALSAKPAAIDPCAALLTNTSLPNTTVTSATTIVGAFTPQGGGGTTIQGLPSFCRVTATLKPSPVSDIKVEVWMPTGGWNGKLQGVGNGGLAGTISYGALAPAVKRGYAAVSTDTGHVASDVTWLPIEEREKDYGYRAIHGMTVASKVFVEQFYGKAAQRSYFNGCSTGGGQGFGEAQLYPKDYDGILSGAPQDFPTHLRAAVIAEFQAANNDPASNLPKPSLSLITTAVLKQCGGKYDVADGFLSNDPRACRFDPGALLCKTGQDPTTCLNAAQVQAAKRIYEGTISPRTKQQLWPGLMPGSEEPIGPGTVGWQLAGINGPTPFGAGAQFYGLAVYKNPNLDFHSLDLATAIALAEKKFPFINHRSLDIDAFLKRGGKLLMYHGWADPLISPLNSINYYGSLVERTQKKRRWDQTAALAETEKAVRLFLVPGMGHCSGGPGPDNFDGIGALDQWVEKGTAPEKIIASHIVKDVPTFSRPLCPYPQEAEYRGSGDHGDATTWFCAAEPFTYDPSFYKGHSPFPPKQSW